ncbi:MAG: DUF3179 domain-containing protein [Nitrospirae bacterium]|nr:DUF3179 domain-containing protein [Nitrospirota bacterium]
MRLFFRFFFLFLLVPSLLGFDFNRHSIPVKEIVSGGPPKDGIPALLKPQFLDASQALFLSDTDRLLELVQRGEAKAYPLKILNWHEIVNDQFGGRPVLITYCPLCGSGMGFDPVIKGKTYTFGVSGLLYKSDVLMYDHETESLWSQLKQEAVTGAMTGARLPLLPLVHTTWGVWRKEHPDTRVLSTETGYIRDYSRDPYGDYATSPRLMFPAGKTNSLYPAKEWMIGIVLDGKAKVYPFSELSKGEKVFSDQVGSSEVHIQYDPVSHSARIKDHSGNDLPAVTSYWFAWTAFYPETEVYRSSR